jgi:hypothetical protein
MSAAFVDPATPTPLDAVQGPTPLLKAPVGSADACTPTDPTDHADAPVQATATDAGSYAVPTDALTGAPSGGTPATAGADDEETLLINGTATMLADGVTGLSNPDRALLIASLADGFRDGALALPRITLQGADGGTPTLPASLSRVLARAYPQQAISPELLVWFMRSAGFDLDQMLTTFRMTTDNSAGVRSLLLAENKDAADQRVETDLAALESELSAPAQLRGRGIMAAATGPSSVVPSAIKAVLADKLRALRELWGDSPSTRRAGMLAHLIIQGHYLSKHWGQKVLIEGIPSQTFSGTYTPWGLDRPADSPWFPAMLAALGLSGLGKPDILNQSLEPHEVYEIKPLEQFLEGNSRLFARYLLPLNAAVFAGKGIDAVAEALKFLASIGLSGAPGPSAPTPTGDLIPYLPGVEYTPPPMMPGFAGTQLLVLRPVPGVIVYKYWAPAARAIRVPADLRETLKDVQYWSKVIVPAVGAASLYPNTEPPQFGPVFAAAGGLNPEALEKAAVATLGVAAGAAAAQVVAAVAIEVMEVLLAAALL